MDILCLGEPMVEFNQQPDGRYLKGFGGDTSNCAIAAVRQGACVGYLTQVGTDAFGDDLMALWQEEGVDTSGVGRNADAPTGIYFVTHGEDGHAFTYRRAGSAVSLMTPVDLNAEAIQRAKVLHVSGISLAISDRAVDTVFAAIHIARDAGVAVSLDTNLRLNLWPLERARAIIHAAATLSDIILPGLDDAAHLTGLDDPDAIAQTYLDRGAKTVALTMGGDGVLVATRERSERISAISVRAVDATGAGDTFDGAFLAEIDAGRDPFDAARYANVAAALSTEGYGAVSPMPRRVDVEARLKSISS